MSPALNLLRRRLWVHLALALCGLAFVFALITNAWVCDDAYITYRTVDNFIHGHGLTWNTGERVQSYTHPLWMFLMSFVVFFTHDVFYTSIVLSIVLTLIAIAIVARALTDGFRKHLERVPLLLLALLASKAFMDFSTSGLETPLTYLLAALFWSRLLRVQNPGKRLFRQDSAERLPLREITILGLITALALVNRYDNLWLFLPGLILAVCSSETPGSRKTIWTLALSFLPLIGWAVFALIYYGTPIPNTAYAKLYHTGFPLNWRLDLGLQYLRTTLTWDAASVVLLGVTIALTIRRPYRVWLAMIASVLLSFAFVVLSGGSSTHMSGKFLAASFFLVAIALAGQAEAARLRIGLAALLAAFIVASPFSSIRFGLGRHPETCAKHRCFIDIKCYVRNEGSALLNWRPHRRLPDHAWYHYGERLRATPGRVHVGGAFGGDAVGYVGYAAGPDKFIVDRLGLTDPLLSRLPAVRPEQAIERRAGHFAREIPDGYVESVARNQNLVQDPDLRCFYEAIRCVTRGPLFSVVRWRYIWDLNLGRYRRPPRTISQPTDLAPRAYAPDTTTSAKTRLGVR